MAGRVRRQLLLQSAAEVIDSYLSQASDDSIFSEPAYLSFNSDLNRFLKWEQLGKPDADTPRLRGVLAVTKQVMGRPTAGHVSPRSVIQQAIGS